MGNLLDRVLLHEGYREKPYQDHLGVWTIGHGLTFITESESKAIVWSRLQDNMDALLTNYSWLDKSPAAVLEVLTEMSFQLGMTGLHNFKNMRSALQRKDYEEAAKEGLDSRWAHQTPERAKELMDIIRNLG